MKLVIVDDESWTREVVKSLGQWEALDIEVVGEASDGEYGLELIRQQRPDLVLTDVKMPRMSGVEMLERLRETDSQTRVVFISGYDDFSYVQSALRLGAADYLLKPLKAKELNDTLLRLKQEVMALRHRAQEGQGMEEFMGVSWANAYIARRGAVEEGLRALRASTLGEEIHRMAGAVPQEERAGLSKALLVAIYYDLLGMLQRHILSLGYEVSAVVEGSRSAIVFSQETTLDTVLSHVAALYEAAVEGLTRLGRGRKSLDMEKIVTYVRENALRGITLEECAEQFFVSREYLSKAFKQHTGALFSEYVMGLRMEKAKELLLSGVPAKEVHGLTGFWEQAHFYKAFKRYFDMTPGEMQKRFTNGQ